MTTHSAESTGPSVAERWRPASITVRRDVDLWDWAVSTLDELSALLREHGAVRVRGAGVTADSFGELVSAVADAPLADYVQRSTPRRKVEGRIYTSTEYRRDQVIHLHSEQSYATSWPKVVGFWCRQPAREGGATTLASNAEVLAGLPTDLVRRFTASGVRYERWYQPFLDLPWPEVFQTDDPLEVDRVCAGMGIETSWYDGGAVLRTRQAAQATIRRDGREVWFNQVGLFHPAALPADTAAALRARAGDRLPRNVLFGDGSPIPDEDVAAVNASAGRATWREPWQADDVLLVDNEAVAHGRDAYVGERTVLVAMAGVGGAPDVR
ncbi:TauD/TfdA family dioxygenase [Actinosynnema sp. NPDC050801]|uniref:TauD/TfdA family dioxygenase n=1 Tax=unclassified Actinosynnema TaxID=2637065 RepID=UPI0033FCD8AD